MFIRWILREKFMFINRYIYIYNSIKSGRMEGHVGTGREAEKVRETVDTST